MAARIVFFLLVLANLVFFVWTQGYFGTVDDGHEPQRLAQQLNAEKLRLTREAPAAQAKKDDPVCRVVAGLNLADAETLKAAIGAAGVDARVQPHVEPPVFLVVIGDLPNKASADKKLAELSRLGSQGQQPVALENGRYEIVLGSFPAEPAAREFMAGLGKRGIKSARQDRRQPPAARASVEARAGPSVLMQLLPKLVAPYADVTVGECTP